MSNPPPRRTEIIAAKPARKLPTRWVALGIAAAADALQLAVIPLFGEGFVSPVNDALDLVVAGALIWLLGFHWVLAPAAASELVPGLDLAPTWTASVLFIIAPGKTRWWIAAGAIALLALAAYAVFRLSSAHSR
jgi:hypothetical protein